MPSVTGYAAGFDTSSTAMSYALETQWATLPATTFQGLRLLSEGLKHTKSRTRPGEIRGDRQAAPGLTTQESASGPVVFPLYYSEAGKASAFEDFASVLLGGDWQTPTTISSASGDIVLTYSGGVGVITSATSNKFLGLRVGQIVKLNGFTNTVNNSFWRVSLVTSSTNVTLVPQGFTGVTETPSGSSGKIYYSNLQNSTQFKSIYMQQRLDSATTAVKWFRYPGCYVTRGQIGLQLGQFLQSTFDVSSQQELKGLLDASTGGIIAPPNTRDMDPVSGFKGIFWNDAPLSSGCDQFTLDFNNDGAAGQYALGSPLAQGMLGGTFTAGGSFRIYMKDYQLYDNFRNETAGVLSIRAGDQAGNVYSFTLPNALLLLNDGVNVEGVNRSLMGTFALEAAPDTASGCTVSIDRFPYTA